MRLCRTSDGPRRRIAREPGCSTESLGRRLEQADVGGGRSEGPAANDLEEPGRLRRENRILRRQSAPSCKKAAARFAREADPGQSSRS